jgi:ribosomal protein S4
MQRKLKSYLKAGISIKKKNQALRFLRNNKIFFLSPDFIYLNSRFSLKIREFFKISILNRQKIKLLFSFPRTSLLKKYLSKERSIGKNSLRFSKELEFCSLLEKRIDILLYRLGFVSTLLEARHLISHKKIKINNFSNSSFSYLLKKGDIISFVPSLHSRIKKRLIDEIACRSFYFNTFGNVEVNLKNLKIIVLTERMSIKQQIQHYSFSINWNSVLKG